MIIEITEEMFGVYWPTRIFNGTNGVRMTIRDALQCHEIRVRFLELIDEGIRFGNLNHFRVSNLLKEAIPSYWYQSHYDDGSVVIWDKSFENGWKLFSHREIIEAGYKCVDGQWIHREFEPDDVGPRGVNPEDMEAFKRAFEYMLTSKIN